MLQRRTITDLSPQEFLISDAVVAQVEGGIWSRGATSLTPFPGHTIRTGQLFKLFYELYGGIADEPVTVHIEIIPEKAQGLVAKLGELLQRKEALSLTFDDRLVVDADGTAQVSRNVSGDLSSGSYTVIVEVKRLSGGPPVVARTALHVR
jgi:hypothetical protein